MHQKIIKDIVGNLDSERAEYFSEILRALEHDSRTELVPNILYAVLKEVVVLVPPYLATPEFINLLFDFVRENSQRITSAMYSSQYVTDSSVLQSVTNEFVEKIIEITYDKHEDGTVDTREKKVRSYSWPYENVDFPFAE